MSIKKLKPNFIDERGLIIDVIDGINVNSITFITSKKGAVRGNHFHKKTIQYLYVLEGKLEYYSQEKAGRIKKKTVTPGHFIVTGKNVKHAFKALEDSKFIACCSGLRAGKQYEQDTYRLEKKIVQ